MIIKYSLFSYESMSKILFIRNQYMNKITIEEIRNYFLKYELILDEEIYINNRTK